MSQTALQQLEEKLEHFKSNLEPGKWMDSAYLVEQAESLRLKDSALALRVLQRARNLNPDDAELMARCHALSLKLKQSNPDIMSSSSNEKVTQIKPLGEASVTEVQRPLSLQERAKNIAISPFGLIVLLPFLCFAFYQLVWASYGYESQTQLIVQQPDNASTLDPSMALLAGLSGSVTSSDTELVRAYIHSNDMFRHLESTLDLVAHYSQSDIDMFSSLGANASAETRREYYQDKIMVDVDDKSSVITVRVKAYTPDFAKQLTSEIVSRAEWYINKIGNDLAKAQLGFVQQEHEHVQKKLQQAKSELLAFQRRYNLLDPEAEGMALQQITYGLESQIASKEAELRMLRSSMSEDAPLVLKAREELSSLRSQLESERSRLTRITDTETGKMLDTGKIGVNEILARYSEYKLNLEFATQAYAASQISMEKSRIEAYRQLKYLVVVEAPIQPEDAIYPRVDYNLSLFLVVLLMIFGIGRIIYATVQELR